MSRLNCITQEYLKKNSKKSDEGKLIQSYLNRLKTFEEKTEFLKTVNQ